MDETEKGGNLPDQKEKYLLIEGSIDRPLRPVGLATEKPSWAIDRGFSNILRAAAKLEGKVYVGTSGFVVKIDFLERSVEVVESSHNETGIRNFEKDVQRIVDRYMTASDLIKGIEEFRTQKSTISNH